MVHQTLMWQIFFTYIYRARNKQLPTWLMQFQLNRSSEKLVSWINLWNSYKGWITTTCSKLQVECARTVCSNTFCGIFILKNITEAKQWMIKMTQRRAQLGDCFVWHFLPLCYLLFSNLQDHHRWIQGLVPSKTIEILFWKYKEHFSSIAERFSVQPDLSPVLTQLQEVALALRL